MTRILLYHLFSNGDCLYATTVAKQIKNDYKDCHLTWAIAANCKSIIANNPYVDSVVEITLNPEEDKEAAFNRHLKEAYLQKEKNVYDHIFVTQIIGDNFSRYDGCVRTSIYRCYGKPITVGYKPVLSLTDSEKKRAAAFAAENNLSAYKNVILFECAPLSGQVSFSPEFIAEFSEKITANGNTAIILSSAKKIPIDIKGVFDGSVLSIRETAAVSNYCTLLVGCSSGITWATTTIEERQIPMIQILDKNAYIYNPPSIAFQKVGDSIDEIIEFYNLDLRSLVDCIQLVFDQNFDVARKKYNQNAPKNFRIFRGIVHMMIQRRKLGKLFSFIKLNIREHGFDFAMIAMMLKGVLFFPVQYLLVKKTKK